MWFVLLVLLLGICIVVVGLFGLGGRLCYTCGLADLGGFVGVLDCWCGWFSGCLCVLVLCEARLAWGVVVCLLGGFGGYFGV